MTQVATGEGVILGVEKRVTSTLLETSSVEKIVEIDRHIGCAMSGLQADARSMIEHARVESQNHAFNYAEKLRVESCTQAICDLALRFGEGAEGEESIMSRPFGVALSIAGYDEDGPSLQVPTGTSFNWKKWADRKTGTTRSPRVPSTATMPKPLVPDLRVHKRSCRMSSTSRSPFRRRRSLFLRR